MGSCQTSNVIEMKSSEKKPKNQKIIDEAGQMSIENQKDMFPDMKEWKGNRYTGVGIKRLKGYKCDLPIDKLNEKRDEFWSCRNSHNNPNYKTWRIINQACVYDEYRANMLLEQYELTTAEGCINHIIDKKGNHYIIPNYCINDPYFEKSFKVKENVEEKELKVNLFDPSDNLNVELKVSNLLTGKQLKEKFRKKANIESKKFNFRFFLGGQEIKDEHFLYQHHIRSDYKIQVMKLPKINDDVDNDADGDSY